MSNDFSDNVQATFDALLTESNAELSKKYNMPEVPGTTSRQLSYGWAQGQNIVGNVVGVAKSATKAASGPSDFDFYAKFNEKLVIEDCLLKDSERDCTPVLVIY